MNKKSIGFILLATVFLFSSITRAEINIWDNATVQYEGNKEITVYRNQGCDCCHRWISHLQKHGFVVNDILVQDVRPYKAQAGVSSQLASCHTAVSGNYFIEGHVPADDIKKLLITNPAVKGLAVPAMPVGSPGMEMPGRKDDFRVVYQNMDGSTGIFNEYSNY